MIKVIVYLLFFALVFVVPFFMIQVAMRHGIRSSLVISTIVWQYAVALLLTFLPLFVSLFGLAIDYASVQANADSMLDYFAKRDELEKPFINLVLLCLLTQLLFCISGMFFPKYRRAMTVAFGFSGLLVSLYAGFVALNSIFGEWPHS